MKKSTRFPDVEWWEMLDWNEMGDTWNNLSEELKNKIRKKGLAPNSDILSSCTKGEVK